MSEWKGIDVSKHQGTIDWGKVKNSGIQFAMLRAGFGKNANQRDDRFEEDYAGAKSAGIPVGAYHYSYAQSAEDAKKEAAFFLDIIKGKQFEYPVAFDIEDVSMAGLGKNTLTQIAFAFCQAVESAGYYTMLYANLDWVTNKLDMAVLGRFDLWLAKWGDNAGYKGNFGMWQVSSTGSVDGIQGDVDVDKSFRDYPLIIKSGGINGFSTPQTIPKMTPAPEPNPAGQTASLYVKGRKITLNKTPIYSSSDAVKPANSLTGDYYLYDGIEFSTRAGKRYRITNNAQLKGITAYIDKLNIK